MKRIDTEILKRDYPVEHVIGRYGIDLHSSGRALVGRCPFHDDRGRPNLYVYPSAASWYCYRCAVGGDVISFVERIEGIGFRDAVRYLTGGEIVPRSAGRHRIHRTKTARNCRKVWGPDERACLAAAVDLYHNCLLTHSTALAYLQGRGLDRSIIERCRIGYVAGDELADYLRWRNLSVGAAMRSGLLDRDGREFLAGRVVVPEIRGGQPIWLVGRTIDPNDDRPKYLGLQGPKPLLGWDTARDSAEVFLVEGVFDWLLLLTWDYPAIALVGTHVRAEVMKAFDRFERIFLLLDNDEAGRAAAESLSRDLKDRAVVIRLKSINDVADLAMWPDGRERLARFLPRMERSRAA